MSTPLNPDPVRIARDLELQVIPRLEMISRWMESLDLNIALQALLEEAIDELGHVCLRLQAVTRGSEPAAPVAGPVRTLPQEGNGLELRIAGTTALRIASTTASRALTVIHTARDFATVLRATELEVVEMGEADPETSEVEESVDWQEDASGDASDLSISLHTVYGGEGESDTSWPSGDGRADAPPRKRRGDHSPDRAPALLPCLVGLRTDLA